jgi:hypothetical protein
VATTGSRSALIPWLFLGWFVAAAVFAATGRLARLEPPGPQFLLLLLTVALVVGGSTWPSFRLWLAGVNLRQIVALHLTRFVGIYFLVLYSRGELPYAFAVLGGWGDIVVAVGALGIVLLVPDLPARRGWIMAWNLVGLADILFVVATAARLAMADPASMQPLLKFPLGLLPTFLVPMIIASHVLLFRRLLPEAVGAPA